jgi:hypothetical protein
MTFLSYLIKSFPHRPILFPMQPHIAQQMFHPRFLAPYSRYNTADCLAALMEDLGWVNAAPPSENEDEYAEKLKKRLSVTVLSHSKYVQS